MDRPTDLGRLKTEEWDLLQEIVERFEQAWQDADSVDLARFLPAPHNPLRQAALLELIKTDLEIRWRRGQTIQMEDYLRHFPELGNSATLSPGLIYEEYRVRQLHGDRPELPSFQQRFPHQFHALGKLLQEQPLPTLSKGTPTPPSPPPLKKGSDPLMTVSGGHIVPGGGSHRLVRRIGSGGFGEVWLTEAPGGFNAAIKILFRPIDHEEAQREQRALEVIRQVRHPFLLQTQQFWIHEDRLYIVMELAEGNLRDRHKECKAQGLTGIPLPELLRYFRESGEAIDYLHSEQVLHRDIKPDNILLLKSHAKVADFGLARSQMQPTISVSGSGTPAYMAPEVWRGKACEASDLYSLALAYAEMRLGRRPFFSNDQMGVMMDHLEGKPDLASLPEPEQAAIRKALSKKPEQRYGSCREFVEVLEAALTDELKKTNPAGGPVGTQGQEPQLAQALFETDVELVSSAPPAIPPARSSLKWAFVGWVLVVLVSAGIVGYFMFRGSSTNSEGSFSLIAPDPVTLHAGEEKTFSLAIKRDRFTRIVDVVFLEAPLFLELPPKATSIPGDQDQLSIRVAAPEDAAMGTYQVTVLAKANDREERTHLKVTIAPPPTVVLKDGWEKAPHARIEKSDGKHYYRRIILNKHGLRIPFVLIPKQHEDDPPTFYMMETKVWNDLFGRFVEQHPNLKEIEWRLGGRRNGEDMLEPDGQLPVFRVPVETAHHFAEWVGGLLPTTQQWDRAAGLHQREGRRGPFLETTDKTPRPRIAINRIKDGPELVGKSEDDVSPSRVRDMAGNGREWTRNRLDGKAVGSIKPFKDDLVILRGRNYTLSRPLLYSDLDEEQTEPQTQYYHKASPYTSFRVVLEP